MAREVKKVDSTKEKMKVNKNEFFDIVAAKNNMPVSTIKDVYNAMLEEMKQIVCSGKELSMVGFGSFSLKVHKGHPVQFEAESNKCRDYVVLKFSASDALMDKIRDAYAKGDAVAKSNASL